jgi:hypothetical protein
MVNWGIGSLNVVIFPVPEGTTFGELMKPENRDALIDWVGSLPQSAFILVLVAHLSQAFVGGFVAALIAKQNMMCVAMVVGFLTMIGGIINILMIPAPVWLWIEMPLYFVVAWCAVKIVSGIRVATKVE